MIRWLSYILILCFPLLGFSAEPTWELVPSESEITFTGIQNNAPISGKFTRFNAEIRGDIDQLEKSYVSFTVDTTSIDLSFKNLGELLKSAEWLDVKLFPTATFTANKFVKLSDNTFEAKGMMIIHGKKTPLNAKFTVENYSPDKARITGSIVLKRTIYDVGRGEWGSTDEVGDEVNVKYVLTAVKKGK